MRAIGVRELRQNASTYLRDVEAGETITITNHGHAVAHLIPATSDHWAALVAAGEVTPAQQPPMAFLSSPMPDYCSCAP